MTTRRTFIKTASSVGALAALPGWLLAAGEAEKPLRLLVLGGTGFIGPHEISYALARGHAVTMFNRGKTAPDMFPDVENLIGDRDGELDALKGREWDAVIDNSGFYPRHARLSAELLHGNVGKYLFVSSISAYADTLTLDDDEFSAAYATMDDPTDESEPPYGPSYGARKALCEQEVAKVFGDDIHGGYLPGIQRLLFARFLGVHEIQPIHLQRKGSPGREVQGKGQFACNIRASQFEKPLIFRLLQPRFHLGELVPSERGPPGPDIDSGKQIFQPPLTLISETHAKPFEDRHVIDGALDNKPLFLADPGIPGAEKNIGRQKIQAIIARCEPGLRRETVTVNGRPFGDAGLGEFEIDRQGQGLCHRLGYRMGQFESQAPHVGFQANPEELALFG